MSRKVLSKLPTSGKKSYFLLATIPVDKDDGFQLVLCNGESVWEGNLSANEMDKQKKKLKMDFKTYFTQTEVAFTLEDDVNFEYTVKIHSDDTAELIWKKHVISDDIKFQLGSVTLMLNDNPSTSICAIFQHSVINSKKCHDRMRHLETDNERLSQERTMALKRLEKCVAAKEDMEKDLFSKFTAVLNSKKEKIRDLKENGADEDGDEEVSESPRASNSSATKNGRKKQTVENEEENTSDNEQNTDEEETPPPKRQRKNVKFDSAGDTSLVLEDKNKPTSSGVAKRPARQRPGTKKATPSKPVLPKVTRTASEESSNTRKNRMSKSSSNNSNISNIDAEDLFDDL